MDWNESKNWRPSRSPIATYIPNNMGDSSQENPKKRGRDQTEDGELDIRLESAEDEPNKRIAPLDEAASNSAAEPNVKEPEEEDTFMAFATGEDMGEEDDAEKKMQDRRNRRNLEDVSNWTLRDLLKSPVPMDPPVEEAGGGDPELRKAVKRAGGGTLAPARAPVPSSIDTDPALSLYNNEEPFAMQVMVGEDGRIIVNQATQVIPQTFDRDTVARTEVDGSRQHITSASFRKKTRAEKWTYDDVETLYEAISMCGTDFSMIEVFFPTRTRAHIKARFKREEKENPQRIEAAIKERKPIDIEDFKERIAFKKFAIANPAAASITTNLRTMSRPPSGAPRTSHTGTPTLPASIAPTPTMSSAATPIQSRPESPRPPPAPSSPDIPDTANDINDIVESSDSPVTPIDKPTESAKEKPRPATPIEDDEPFISSTLPEDEDGITL